VKAHHSFRQTASDIGLHAVRHAFEANPTSCVARTDMDFFKTEDNIRVGVILLLPDIPLKSDSSPVHADRRMVPTQVRGA
jgi:hypothetical protein